MNVGALGWRRVLRTGCPLAGLLLLLLAVLDQSASPADGGGHHYTIKDSDFLPSNHLPDANPRFPVSVREPLTSAKYQLSALAFTPEDVRGLFFDINQDQLVRNDRSFKFAPIRFVLLVMVHDRAEYLSHLIDSLRAVRRIEEALVVFSHDVYDEPVFQHVQNITFARVMQIAFPFSLQIFPDSFPGQSASDCPRDATKAQLPQLTCANKNYPDQYGHYRESKFTVIKHHWWWKLNHVMDELPRTLVSDEAEVVLLEEDHFLAPDALELLVAMRDRLPELCPQCSLLQIGDYKSPASSDNPKAVRIDAFVSSRNNMAFVLRRNIWEDIKACANAFCTYGDYNWDWSLTHISKNCIPDGELQVLVPILPRVMHAGVCGVHKKDKTRKCDPKSIISGYLNKVKHVPTVSAADLLLVKPAAAGKPKKPSKPNGGWSDPRDHKLCMSFVHP